MLPTSESLESLLDRAKALAKELRVLKSQEVTKASTKESLAEIAREWIKVSQVLRSAGFCEGAKLSEFDSAMRDLLEAAGNRARASALQKRIQPFLDGALDHVIVPLIQHEGSPRQVAGRQLQAIFDGTVTSDEQAYIEEASRCITVQATRASIIMLWAAGIARLHGAIVRIGFDKFNAAVDRIVAKKGQPFNRVKESSKLSSLPELQRAKDSDLIILGMELFGYDLQIYQELDRLLSTRNDCAHPGMAHPGVIDVQQFAAKLRDALFGHVKTG